MKFDFTLDVYKKLIISLKKANYTFLTFENFLSQSNKESKIVIMRHDVDKSPENALNMAKLENKFDIQASYFFRIIPKSFNKTVIKDIVALNHEIGYHYEDMALAKGNYKLAIKLFEKNLYSLRQLYPIKTICMHGSPLSQVDNRIIWDKINYSDYGIIGEPYFDIDFQNAAYLTDTGRKWNSSKENVRDKVNSNFIDKFKTTFDVLDAVEKNELPPILMINIHPQRWNTNSSMWFSELVLQNSKNIIKRLIRFRK